MERLDLFKKLQALEEAKVELENMLHDVSDYYCDGVNLSVALTTQAFDYRQKYKNSFVNVNKTRFIGYLKQEIDGIEREISDLVDKLKL